MKKPQKPAKKATPAKKAAPQKAPAKKAAPAKAPAKKVEAKKAAPAKAPAKKVEVKKVETKKVEAKKPAPAQKALPLEKLAKKAESKTTGKAAPAVETKKVDTKKAEPKKEEKKLSKKEEKELLKKGKGKKAETFEEEILEQLESKSKEDEDDFDDFESGEPKKVKMVFDEIEEEEVIPVRKKKAGFDEDIKENLAEEILAMSEDYKIEDIFSSIRNMDLFKVESDECLVRGCDNPSTTNGYCRYHYIKFWKDVKKKEQILMEGRLAKIIEELVRKYPVKYIETIIQDLADDKAFSHVLKDLDIETDAEDLDTFEDDELLDDDQDIAFETKVVKPSFDD